MWSEIMAIANPVSSANRAQPSNVSGVVSGP